MSSEPVPKLQEFVKIVNVKRARLHSAPGYWFSSVTCVSNSPFYFFGVFGVLNESDIGAFRQLGETVIATFDAMHPIESLRGASKDLSEERQLGLHIASCDCQVVNAVWVEGHT
jgi:hypothetical protein